MKPGFKQTEVGVIPEDWEVKSIRELGQLSKGKGIRKNEADSGSIPCIRYGELYTHHNDVIRLYNSRISEQVAKTSRRLNKGDILFAGSGETKEEIGKCAAFIGDEIAYAGGDILVLTPNQGDPRYFGYLFNAPAIARQKAGKGQGDAIVHITAPALSSVRVPLPPTVAEQEAIASALGDADALIESLERLIAKKRDVKQGAMQELLTARRRLPSFTGEWEEKPFRIICWFQEGPGVRNTQFTTSGVKLLNGTNIFRGKLNLDSTSRYISEHEAYGPYAHFLADAGDIVIASSGIAIDRFHEKVAFVESCDLPFCMNTSTIRFKPVAEQLTPAFLFQYLTSDSFKRAIGGQATGSAQLNFGPSHVEKVYVILPPVEEQTAIAAVLSDMDAELAALEAKLAKARAIKQGMMQELLTGRIRLK